MQSCAKKWRAIKWTKRLLLLTLRRSAEMAKAGKGQGAAASMFKYYGTEMNKRRFELFIGADGYAFIGH